MQFRQKVKETNPLISSYLRRYELVSVLDESKVGVVICDRKLRYKALNQTLADIHNEPIKAHIGRSLHKVLGNFADQIAPIWESVFASGHCFTNLEVIGKLPKRTGMGRWVENLFPLTDRHGKVENVGCFAIEIIPIALSRPAHSNPPAKARSGGGGSPTTPQTNDRPVLSHREQEVLRLLAEGKSTRNIAGSLLISVRTVETYRARLMLKLQAGSFAELVHYAIQNCIIKL